MPSRVHTFHGNVFEGYFSPRMSAAVLTAERLAARTTTRTIVLSEEQRQELVDRRIGRPERVQVIPLGLEIERFTGISQADARTELGLAADEVVLVAAGRLAPIKRIDRLLRVFAARPRPPPGDPPVHRRRRRRCGRSSRRRRRGSG